MSLSIHHSRYQKLRAQMKNMRLSAGLTQKHMAERLGVNQSHISKIENGDRYIELLFYMDWCGVCGQNAAQSIGELLDGF